MQHGRPRQSCWNSAGVCQSRRWKYGCRLQRSLRAEVADYFLIENQILALSAIVIQGMCPELRAGLSVLLAGPFGGSSLGQRPANFFIFCGVETIR